MQSNLVSFSCCCLLHEAEDKRFSRDRDLFPNILSPLAVGIMFSSLMHPTKGLINQVLSLVGVLVQTGWVNPRLDLYSIILHRYLEGVGVSTVHLHCGN